MECGGREGKLCVRGGMRFLQSASRSNLNVGTIIMPDTSMCRDVRADKLFNERVLQKQVQTRGRFSKKGHCRVSHIHTRCEITQLFVEHGNRHRCLALQLLAREQHARIFA